MSNKSESHSLGKWLADIFAGIIIGVAIWSFTHQGGILNPVPMQGPGFTISAINTLAGDNVYEVTNNLIRYDILTSTLRLNLGVEVVPTYSGGPLGEIQVLVKNKDSEVVARDSWKPFTKDSGPLQLIFKPNDLRSIVDPQQVPYQEVKGSYVYPSADLLVEISKVSDTSHPLYTSTLKVLNTPWYHFTRVVPNYINPGRQTADIYVKGRNLGAPSEFLILAEAYEITATLGGPNNPWPKRDWIVQDVGKVERDAEFTAQVTLPTSRFSFEPGKCYVVRVFAIKKQNYAEFPGSGWINSGDAWRFGDWDDETLACF